MKNLKLMMMTLMMSLMFMSCDTSISEKVSDFNPYNGHFIFTNFNGRDSVTFNNSSDVKIEQKLRDLVFNTCLEAKSVSKNPLTFKPKRALISKSNDTITVFLDFQASNSFGVPGELVTVCKFIDGNLLDDKSISFER
jgi:hypothetical protein